MRHLTACICMLILLGSASGQTKQSPTRPTPAVVIAPVGSGAKLDPVTLTRASLDEKVITLRLSPRVATSIRMPEPVYSVVIGDPERFQAEHSEHEPELVRVKPVSAAPAQTNLLITTTLGAPTESLADQLRSAERRNADGRCVVEVRQAHGRKLPRRGESSFCLTCR